MCSRDLAAQLDLGSKGVSAGRGSGGLCSRDLAAQLDLGSKGMSAGSRIGGNVLTRPGSTAGSRIERCACGSRIGGNKMGTQLRLLVWYAPLSKPLEDGRGHHASGVSVATAWLRSCVAGPGVCARVARVGGWVACLGARARAVWLRCGTRMTWQHSWISNRSMCSRNYVLTQSGCTTGRTACSSSASPQKNISSSVSGESSPKYCVHRDDSFTRFFIGLASCS